MVELNELPPYILLKIFSYLPVDEVIRLKLVCKAWQEISYYVRLKSLSVYHSDLKDVDCDDRLPYYKRYKNLDLYVNDLEKFLKFTESLVTGLKRLACFFPAVNNENDRMQSFLNRFKRVEELEITVFQSYRPKHPIKFLLEFERLRKLFLRYEERAFELNCPQLSYLDVRNLTDCRILYPEKLRTLAVKELFDKDQIGKFVNLKNLIVFLYWEEEHPNLSSRTFFEGLPKALQRLIFFKHKFFSARFSSEHDLENCFRAQYSIDQEDSSGLKVFYLGIEIALSRFTSADREPLPRSVYDENFSNFLVTNLANSVDANVCFDFIHYNKIERLLPTFDPLYEKIYSVHPNCCISLEETVDDQARLFEFIQKAKPASLSLCDGAVFSRPFFDRLTEICSSFLKELHFDAANLGTGPGALDFLFKMAELEKLTLNSNLATILDLVIAAFEKMQSLDHFGFDHWFVVSPTNYLSVLFFSRDKDGVKQPKMADTHFFEQRNVLDVLRTLRK